MNLSISLFLSPFLDLKLFASLNVSIIIWKLYLITAEAAQKDLRKRGVVLASKKSSRTAAEGLLALAQNEKKAVVVELNCETDFVARNDIFQSLVGITFLPCLFSFSL